jgi:hypothetical protein
MRSNIWKHGIYREKEIYDAKGSDTVFLSPAANPHNENSTGIRQFNKRLTTSNITWNSEVSEGTQLN